MIQRSGHKKFKAFHPTESNFEAKGATLARAKIIIYSNIHIEKNVICKKINILNIFKDRLKR